LTGGALNTLYKGHIMHAQMKRADLDVGRVAADTPPGPLRVLQVCLGYFPYAGGVETHVYEVSRRLARAGVDVTVLTVDLSGQLPRSEEVDGVRVQRVGAWPANREFCVAPGLYKAIARGHWDVIHCQGVHSLVPPLAMLAAWRAKTPFVVTFHTGGHTSRLRNAIRGMQWATLRPLLARATRLIAVSKFEARFFRQRLRLPSERFATIQNGSHLPHLAPRVVVETVGASGPDPLIVSVGRLERYKGHHRVIAALPCVREQYPDARLLILGSGPYEADLRQLALSLGIADRVEIRMIPPGERQEMASTLASASLMTLLSDYEAHPIAVMEALALKCPVLVSDNSGFHELAEEGLVRAIPQGSDAAVTAAAMVEQLRAPMVPASVDLPTWDGCAAQLIDIYRSVVRETQCAS